MPSSNPDTPLGRGCGKVPAVLACIVGLLLVAVFVVGWITVTGLVSANQ